MPQVLSGSRRRKGPKLTHRPIVGDGVHAEGELLAGVLQQLAPLGEGLGDHLALLDAFGLIITLSRQPESRGEGGKEEEQSLLIKSCDRPQNSTPLEQGPPEGLESSRTLRTGGLLCKDGGLECRAPVCPVLKSLHS